jgi:hypothetical protein
MYVCMFGHNSGTPGAISTKLGTHIAICMCQNLMYILFLLSIIFSREDGVGGLHGIHPPPPKVTNRCRGNVYADRYRSNSSIVCVVLEHTYKHASICISVREPPTSSAVSHDSKVLKFLCIRSVWNSVIDDTR